MTKKSKRLTEEDKSRILEQFDDALIPFAAHFVDPGEGREFNEGVSAGILLATEILMKDVGGSRISPFAKTTLMAVMGVHIRASEASESQSEG